MTRRKSDHPESRYEGRRIHALVAIPGFRPHRLVERYNPAYGPKKTEVACDYEVLVKGKWVVLCRYDSYHGEFHRHGAYYGEDKPPKRLTQIDKRFGRIPMKDRWVVAAEDIEQNARAWHALIKEEEGEVSENGSSEQA